MLLKYKANINFVNPIFFKFFIERCMQCGYTDPKFYMEIETEVVNKKITTIQLLKQDILNGKFTNSKDKHKYSPERVYELDKELEILNLVKDYCRNMYDDKFQPQLIVFDQDIAESIQTLD